MSCNEVFLFLNNIFPLFLFAGTFDTVLLLCEWCGGKKARKFMWKFKSVKKKAEIKRNFLRSRKLNFPYQFSAQIPKSLFSSCTRNFTQFVQKNFKLIQNFSSFFPAMITSGEICSRLEWRTMKMLLQWKTLSCLEWTQIAVSPEFAGCLFNNHKLLLIPGKCFIIKWGFSYFMSPLIFRQSFHRRTS